MPHITSQNGILIDIHQMNILLSLRQIQKLCILCLYVWTCLSFHHILQLLVLLLQLSDQLVLGAFIDLGLVLDRLNLVGVFQSWQGLLVVDVSRGESCYHSGFGVTSQSVLKHTGQLGFTIWDDQVFVLTFCFWCQDWDTLAQKRQTLVNIWPLNQPLPSSLSTLIPLTPCKINQIYIRPLLVQRLPKLIIVRLFERDRGDSMSSWRSLIHLGRPDRPVRGSKSDLSFNFIVAMDWEPGKTIHVDVTLFVFTDFETAFCTFFNE